MSFDQNRFHKTFKDELNRGQPQAVGTFSARPIRKALSAALNQAIRVPYRVLDDKGQVVAQGLVDGVPNRLLWGSIVSGS